MAEMRNRRRGPDFMVRIITFFNIASWLVIILALFIYELTHGSGGSYSTIRLTILDFTIGLVIVKVLLVLNFVFCIWGMAINMTRHKRKADRFSITLILSAAVSLAGFILMFFIF